MIKSSYASESLSDLIELMHQGINTAADKVEYESKGTAIIQSRNFTSGILDLGEVKYLGQADSDKYRAKYTPVRGDILFSNIGTVGRSVIVGDETDFVFAWNVFLIRVNHKKLDKSYLKFYLDYLHDMGVYESWFTGGTVKFLNKKTIGSIEIPLPPLETQKQIAAVLETADQLRKDCQQMEQELNSLAQSVFIDMFGDPVTNPKGWDLALLSDVVKNIQGGKSPKCDSRPAGANEWGVLKLSAVTGGFYKPNQNKAILEGTLPNSDIELRQGDLLFTRKNTYELVGACAYVRETPDRLMLPDLIFRFHMPEKLKIYFWGLLNNTSFKLKVRALASGAAGSMPNIAKSKLNMLELPLPSDKAVLSYTNAIQEIWEQQITLKQLLSSYQEQFDVLMQKAFKGELDL